MKSAEYYQQIYLANFLEKLKVFHLLGPFSQGTETSCPQDDNNQDRDLIALRSTNEPIVQNSKVNLPLSISKKKSNSIVLITFMNKSV